MISSRKSADADRAVSDMIAFVLVFAVIIGSVAVLSTVGFQTMTDYQEGEQLRNSERAMVSLADNFNDVLRYDGIERRYGELSLRGGTVTTGNSGTNLTITIDNGPSPDATYERDLGEFAYESGSDTIAYEGGGVVRSDGDGSVVLERPRLTCSSGTAIVSLVEINSENRSVGGSSGLGVTITETNRTRTVHSGIDAVTVEADSPAYDGAWEDALGSSSGWSCGSADRVVVTIVTAEIEF